MISMKSGLISTVGADLDSDIHCGGDADDKASGPCSGDFHQYAFASIERPAHNPDFSAPGEVELVRREVERMLGVLAGLDEVFHLLVRHDERFVGHAASLVYVLEPAVLIRERGEPFLCRVHEDEVGYGRDFHPFLPAAPGRDYCLLDRDEASYPCFLQPGFHL